METAGARARSWWRCGIALVAAGAVLMPIGQGKAAEADRLALLTPGLGCGPAEGSIGTSLVARVRATRRPQQRAVKPRTRSSAEAQPSPVQEETPALFLHAFYTCIGTPPTPMPVGTGWLAVGPIRRG